jgi:hypothetical protein
LLGAHYGSQIGHDPRSFNERELDLATAYQKPFLLYVQSLEPATPVSPQFASLIAVLRDELVGTFAGSFDSVNSLCTRVRTDLTGWYHSPKAGLTLAIQQLLSDPASRSVIRAINNGLTSDYTTGGYRRFDPDYFQASFHAFHESRIADRYGEALFSGTFLLSYLSNTNPPRPLQRSSLVLLC